MINLFKSAMQEIVDYRGGKVRVPGLEPYQYTYYVHQEAWNDALDSGYIDEECEVTQKFRDEYGLMFDRIGKIVQ